MFERAQKHTNRAFPVVSHGAGFVQIYPSKSKTTFSLSLRRVRGERNPDLALDEWEVDGRNESALGLVQLRRKPACFCLLFYSHIAVKRQIQDLYVFFLLYPVWVLGEREPFVC